MENEYIKFWFENGILFSEYKKPIDIDLKNAEEVIELRHAISKGEKQYWCYSIIGLKSLTKEGRDYVKIYGQEMLYATAVIVNSHITQFMFNTFLKLLKPAVPMQAFKSKEKAVDGLNKLKNENEKR